MSQRSCKSVLRDASDLKHHALISYKPSRAHHVTNSSRTHPYLIFRWSPDSRIFAESRTEQNVSLIFSDHVLNCQFLIREGKKFVKNINCTLLTTLRLGEQYRGNVDAEDIVMPKRWLANGYTKATLGLKL